MFLRTAQNGRSDSVQYSECSGDGLDDNDNCDDDLDFETTTASGGIGSVSVSQAPGSRIPQKIGPGLEENEVLQQIDQENVSGVLRKLDSIRQLAGDAQVLRRKENREQNTRRLHIAHTYSLLLEEAEFNPQNVQQRNVVAMLEGIMLQNAEIFFFSVEDARKNLTTGPSVKLKDAISRPYRYAERLVVDTELLGRMLTELQTGQILEILNKTSEYLTFKQTTYQVKSIEERDSQMIMNATSMAVYRQWLFVADAASHCIWRFTASRFEASGAVRQGVEKAELFAGKVKATGFVDGNRLDARFQTPMGIVVADAAEKMFIADTDNGAIRQVDLVTDVVTTIRIEVDMLTRDVLKASFIQPKGICVIKGEKCMLDEMERCQDAKNAECTRASEGDVKKGSRKKGKSGSSSSFKSGSGSEDSSSETSTSSSTSSGSGSRSGSVSRSGSQSRSRTSSGSTSSSSGSRSSSTSGTEYSSASSSSSSADRTKGQSSQATTAGLGASSSPSRSGHGQSADEEVRSLEQSLDLSRITRYSVLQATEPDHVPSRREADGAGLSSSVDFGAVVSRCHSVRSSRPVSASKSLLASRRQSISDAVFDEFQDPLQKIRLAVTCDHCIWFINPVTGHARIIAGHPTQYGYCDAPLGLDCRFSSPKGLINVRSVLFVCDYWNNVVRCVNLYSTQVDTVVDFCPQGPSAISMSSSGVLYILDSDVVHYTNMLQIMSTPHNRDGSNSVLADDRWWYSNLFSQPRTRSSSSVSASTHITKGSEIYDANTTHTKRLVGENQQQQQQNGVKNAWPTVPVVTDTSQNFRSRLEAHLREAAEVQEKEKRHKGKKGRRHRHKDKKRRKGNYRKRHSNHKWDASRSHNAPALLSPDTNRNASPTFNFTVKSPMKTPSKTPPRIDGGNKNDGTGSPRSATKRSGVISPHKNDYVEQTKMYLSALGTSDHHVDAPMTLSDLGIGSRRGSVVAGSAPAPWGGNRSTMLVGQDNEHTVIMSGGGPSIPRPEAGTSESSGAGTVIVHGGKVFYRTVAGSSATHSASAWTEMRQEDSSRACSRRQSMVAVDMSVDGNTEAEDTLHFQGVDEEGFAVSFNDLTRSNCSTPVSNCSTPESYRGIAARRRSSLAVPNAQRRSFCAGTQLDTTQARNALAKSAVGSRRASMNVAGAPRSRRESGVNAEEPIPPPAQRRKSLCALVPDSSENEARRSSIMAAINNYMSENGTNSEDTENTTSAEVTRKRVSISDPNRAHPGDCSLLVPSSAAGDQQSMHRRSVMSRRSSVVVNIMPTVLDRDEDDNDSERDSDEGDDKEESDAEGDDDEQEDDEQDAGSSRPSGKGASSSDPQEGGRDGQDTESRSNGGSRGGSGSGASPTASNSRGGSTDRNGGTNSSRKCSSGDATRRTSDGSELDNRLAGFKVLAVQQSGVPTPSTYANTGACSPEPYVIVTQMAGGAPAPLSKSPPPALSKDRKSETSLGGMSNNSISTSSTTSYVSLSQMPFTRDLDVDAIQKMQAYRNGSGSLDGVGDDLGSIQTAADMLMSQSSSAFQDYRTPAQLPTAPSSNSRRTTTALSAIAGGGKSRRGGSKTWRTLALPEPLSSARRTGRKYPNTPLALAWFEDADEAFLFVGLLSFPTVLKILPPKHHEPDKPGRFNVLPIDSNRVLLADEKCHQIWLLNHQTKMKRHLAGCGKCGYQDGPLGICRLHSPCSMTLDPRSHYIYVADRGNHMIRKIDLLSGLVSTVVGSGCRGNCDGSNRRRQALDSPFEVSFAEPHYLIISCADNSIRSFNLLTNCLETILVGS
eukprot:TRINITY_DN9299_c0_g2_i1.p1 TRINITY_DN9299_c0_g2~~TRINITY_DN9299_c0_g2_i1.p1  ORF type:complete len:1793 (-),score=361.83 TRINITY_DN9299_c0_g2_i1:34-5412(-)